MLYVPLAIAIYNERKTASESVMCNLLKAATAIGDFAAYPNRNLAFVLRHHDFGAYRRSVLRLRDNDSLSLP